MKARALIIAMAAVLLADTGMTQVPQRQQRQERHASDTGMMMAHMRSMMPTMMPGPSTILRMREALKLTPDQVQRLERIRDSVQQTRGPHQEQAMAALREASNILDEPNPDLSRYEAKLKEAANHFVLAHVSRTRGWIEARQVLTEEQRSNVDFGLRVMQQLVAEQMREAMGEMHPGVTTDSTQHSPRW
ncbi:MAG TPA: Spy/CpxP family protein refolding chaperone [Gemmatimonadaceae bacterium]